MSAVLPAVAAVASPTRMLSLQSWLGVLAALVVVLWSRRC